MSGVLGELALVGDAFNQPALSLLHKRSAATVVTIFRTCFDRDVRSIRAARLHALTDNLLAELRTSGTIDDIPAGSGRDACQRWVRQQWLIRSTETDGSETYSLTSHAQQALKFVQDLRRERPNLSEHRITNIVSTARRINSGTNPNRDARIELLDEDINRLVAERDRLQAGGEMPDASADYLIEGFVELLSLVSQLPSDFTRVEEAFSAFRADVLEAFRAEERTPGDVIDYYLTKTDALMDATREGRAFEGAFALLRDEALLKQLRDDLTDLLEHPTSSLVLNDQDRRELRGIVPSIRSGLSSVLAQRNRVSTTLRDFIITRDVAGDRELDRVLRSLESALATWMQTAGARESVPLALLPGRLDMDHLRERFHDPSEDDAPLLLADVAEIARPESPTLGQLRAYGGPLLAELQIALSSAERQQADWTMGTAFHELPDNARRPVDVLGLLHLASSDSTLRRAAGTEPYATIRPDGSTRTLAVPTVTGSDEGDQPE